MVKIDFGEGTLITNKCDLIKNATNIMEIDRDTIIEKISDYYEGEEVETLEYTFINANGSFQNFQFNLKESMYPSDLIAYLERQSANFEVANLFKIMRVLFK